jgi:hypothetical protein
MRDDTMARIRRWLTGKEVRGEERGRVSRVVTLLVRCQN